jgi:hypothetical protein
MRRLFFQISALVVIALVAYLGLFKRQAVMEAYEKSVREAKGFTPAKTPTEALDKFRAAVKDRDYETAATYCGGDFAEQLRKGAKGAKELGNAIDNLTQTMDNNGIHKTERVKLILLLLEPFPTEFTVKDVITDNNKAVAILLENGEVPLRVNARTLNWRVDPLIFRSLTRGLSPQVELQSEAEGDPHWKIYFPVTDELRLSVDKLRDNYKDYVKALEKVKSEVNTDATTKADLERRLQTELEEASRQ